MGTYTSLSPATGEVFATYPEISDAELTDIVNRAHSAYRDWKDTPATKRAEALRAIATEHRNRQDELARIITEEMGKPIAQAKGEIALVANIFDYYADNLEKFLADEELEFPGKGTAVIRTQPLGALLGVMPWNYPFYQVARFAAPNIGLGNTIIIKHARNCPRSALAIADVLKSAGLPDGVYTNVFISNAQVSRTLESPLIQGVSLTGSERAGAAVAEAAGRNLKKCVLELGGSDPLIVCKDADIALAAKGAAANRLGNTGQACTASKRLFVHEDVYDEFLEKLREEYTHYAPRDPLAEDSQLGPLSSADALSDLQSLVDDAVSHGATVAIDGGPVPGEGDNAGEKSNFFEPMLLTDVTEEMRIDSEEAFGPVAVAYRFSTIEEAAAAANKSPYGLGASVFTEDDDTFDQLANELEVGMVWQNATAQSRPELPFGGVKLSGFGRELSRFGFNEFANKKLVQRP